MTTQLGQRPAGFGLKRRLTAMGRVALAVWNYPQWAARSEALRRQQEGEEKRLELYPETPDGDALPLSIGGGIGQSGCVCSTCAKHIGR